MSDVGGHILFRSNGVLDYNLQLTPLGTTSKPADTASVPSATPASIRIYNLKYTTFRTSNANDTMLEKHLTASYYKLQQYPHYGKPTVLAHAVQRSFYAIFWRERQY